MLYTACSYLGLFLLIVANVLVGLSYTYNNVNTGLNLQCHEELIKQLMQKVTVNGQEYEVVEITTSIDLFPFTGIITLVIGVVFGIVFVCHHRRSRVILTLSIVLILGSLVYPTYRIVDNMIKVKCIGCLANYLLDIAIVFEIIAGLLLLAAFEGSDKIKQQIRRIPQLRLNLDEKMLIA